MSIQMRGLLSGGLGELRHEPTAKRIRAVLGGAIVVDSTRAVLVWEPRRIVPSYAVPVQDIAGEVVRAGAVAAGAADGVGSLVPDVSGRPVLSPADPFAVHTAEGQVADVPGRRAGPALGGVLPRRSGPGRVRGPGLRRLRRLV